DAAFANGDLDAAERLLELMTDRFRTGLAPALDGELALLRMRLAAARRGEGEVAGHARAALQLFDSMHMPFWVAVTQTEYGEWLALQGRSAESEEVLARAAPAFAELGALPWMARMAAPAAPVAESRTDTALPA
ncbi:MAG: hypothetical protein ACRDNK_21095, partial [Solirubrobacteraceae bacterium]